MAKAIKRIALDRRVCVVRDSRIEVRPERMALIGPLIGLTISLALFVSVALFASELPVAALAAMLVPGLILGPVSGMGVVYSLVGNPVVIDARKQSATFQQGVLGLGLGTVELVPFWKIDRLEVQDLSLGEVEPSGPPPPLDLRAWDVVLIKQSGKELSVGQVIAANTPDLIDEGFDRALDVAEAIASMVGSEVVIAAAVEEPVEQTQGSAETPQEDPALPARPGSEAEGSQRA